LKCPLPFGPLVGPKPDCENSGLQRGVAMSGRRSRLSDTLLTVLAVVVLAQSSVLAWLILGSPDRDRLIDQLRSRPIETIVEVCTPATGPATAARTAFRDPASLSST
jgi:hypothetical protein